jgi:hypothetical protein
MKMNIAVKGSRARVNPRAAWLAGRPVSEEDLIRTAVKIVPLSRTMNEQINHIRAWAFERAVRASLRG